MNICIVDTQFPNKSSSYFKDNNTKVNLTPIQDFHFKICLQLLAKDFFILFSASDWLMSKYFNQRTISALIQEIERDFVS